MARRREFSIVDKQWDTFDWLIKQFDIPELSKVTVSYLREPKDPKATKQDAEEIALKILTKVDKKIYSKGRNKRVIRRIRQIAKTRQDKTDEDGFLKIIHTSETDPKRMKLLKSMSRGESEKIQVKLAELISKLALKSDYADFKRFVDLMSTKEEAEARIAAGRELIQDKRINKIVNKVADEKRLRRVGIRDLLATYAKLYEYTVKTIGIIAGWISIFHHDYKRVSYYIHRAKSSELLKYVREFEEYTVLADFDDLLRNSPSHVTFHPNDEENSIEAFDNISGKRKIYTYDEIVKKIQELVNLSYILTMVITADGIHFTVTRLYLMLVERGYLIPSKLKMIQSVGEMHA
ncbi:MAG: hypothetical protein M1344_02610 [Candidatus Thermoplasmatota archaeon]|nr:hypothetical protein [Candidatus Thermoplasmatota archaeon]